MKTLIHKQPVRQRQSVARRAERGPVDRPAAIFDARAISRRIAALCEGRSLSELGAMTGFSHETARRVLSGATAPSARFVVELCCAFGISTDWLLLGKEPDSRQSRGRRAAGVSQSPGPRRQPGPERAREDASSH